MSATELASLAAPGLPACCQNRGSLPSADRCGQGAPADPAHLAGGLGQWPGPASGLQCPPSASQSAPAAGWYPGADSSCQTGQRCVVAGTGRGPTRKWPPHPEKPTADGSYTQRNSAATSPVHWSTTPAGLKTLKRQLQARGAKGIMLVHCLRQDSSPRRDAGCSLQKHHTGSTASQCV